LEEVDRCQYEAGAYMLAFVTTVHRDVSV
jgi:hypothetical protein